MKILLGILATIFSIQFDGRSQTGPIQPEQWSDKPSLHVLDSKYQNEVAVIISDLRRVQYVDDSKNEVHMFYTDHKIIRVNNDHGIESFNKVYIPTDGALDIKEIHARAILSNGKVIEVANSNIKDINDEKGNTYKIFAFDGLESGSEVEYYYTIEYVARYIINEPFQVKVPILSPSLELIYPDRLTFEIKPYHCQPAITQDSLISNRTITLIKLPELEAAEEEKYSAYSSNLARIEFKLSYNKSKAEGQRLFTWNELARKMYKLYNDVPEKELVQLRDFVKQRNWAGLPNDSAKIEAVENFVKSNFAYREDAAEDASEIDKILRNRIANQVGIMRFYAAIFNELGVNYQFVLATDRAKLEIDRNFENWNNCDYAFFYFPGLNGYLLPTRNECRFPLILPDWAGGNGLFCKNISIGSMSSAIAEIKPIPFEDYSKSYSNLIIQVKFNESLDSLLIDSRSIFGGYTSIYYREPFAMATENDRREIFKNMSKSQLGTESILKSEVENLSWEDAYRSKPFVVHQIVRSGDMVEKAGQKILVKIGLVIGPQVEMYQEKKRRTPISMDYPHAENRSIRFVIPNGYQVENLDNINIRQVCEESGKQIMGFVSGYELKDDVVDIEIREDYRRGTYPIGLYDQFVKVINASSDFNKVVLVLKKK